MCLVSCTVNYMKPSKTKINRDDAAVGSHQLSHPSACWCSDLDHSAVISVLLPENSVAYTRGLVHTHLLDFKYTHVKSFVAVSWTIMTLSWWQNLSTDRHINICESSQNHLCGSSRYSSCLHNHILPWWHTGRLTIWKQYQPCCHDCWQIKIWTLATDV